ncbi:MAG: response regulator [Myxococcota bacterium]
MSVSIDALSVVLVEPSKAQSHIAKSYLQQLGISLIRHYTTGETALDAMFSECTPDVVFSSMYLSDMTGTDLVLRLRNHDKTRDICFSLMSSEQNPEYLEPLRQAGVISILPKPLTIEGLRQTFRSITELYNPKDMNVEIYLDQVKVLLVDDSATARRFMKRVLESLGLENIKTAKDGVEAVEMLEEVTYDLIVTDLHMPRMDGIELVDWIRNCSLRPSVPILMATSEQNEDVLHLARENGVTAICDKPFEPQLVREILQDALSGEDAVG